MDGLSITDLFVQLTQQLDALIRGRKIDQVALNSLSGFLLSRSFDVKESPDSDSLVHQGIKLHNLLRSPRFSNQEGGSKFISFDKPSNYFKSNGS